MPTKREIDELAELRAKVDAAKKELQAAESAYERKLRPLEEYVDARVQPDQGLKLLGKLYELDFGRKRAVRKLINPMEGLRRLEAVSPGLGFASISIPVSVFDKNLRAQEAEGLFELAYGGRSVKVVKLV